ncbi:MAG: DUF3267 domain-containing protein [Clostridiaceae bacterium]
MKIKWKGKLSETNPFPTVEMPSNAVQFLEPKYKLESYIAVVPIIAFIAGCVYVRSHFIGEVKLNLPGYIIGFLLTVPFLTIHELLHAVCFPTNAVVEIFYTNSGLGAFTSTPIPKSRYIFTLLFPAIILGIIPLLTWVFVPYYSITLNSIWFILSAGNLGGTIVDFYNLVHAIKEMPKGSVLQVSGLNCYYY